MAYLASSNGHGAERAVFARTFGLWSFGNHGVELFFVLSGFLLFRPYARELLGGPPGPALSTFYLRRARRVLPAYWVALAIFVVVILPLTGVRASVGNVALHAFMLHNASPAAFHSINSVFWTMAVEVQFYVALPLIAAGLIWIARRSLRLSVATLVMATLIVTPLTPLVVGGIAHVLPSSQPFLGLFSAPQYFATFGAGMAAALFDVWLRATPDRRSPMLWARRLAAGGAVLLAFRVGLNLERQIAPGDHFLFEVYLGLAFGGVLIGALHAWPRVGRVLSSRTLRWVAVVSYSVYIWHLVIYTYVITPLAVRLSGGAIFPAEVLATPAVLGIAWLSYRLTEQPFFHRAKPSPAIGVIDQFADSIDVADRPDRGNFEKSPGTLDREHMFDYGEKVTSS